LIDTASKTEKIPAQASSAFDKKCGFVAILGQANAGKSTLINALIGQKISIVSSKPHTTRYGIYGIVCRESSQIIFWDTPGLIPSPKKGLQAYMAKTTRRGMQESDVVVVLIDATIPIPDSTFQLLNHLKDRSPIVALNKVDALKKEKLLPLADQLQNYTSSIMMISGKKRDGLETLLESIVQRLPHSPWLFGKDDLTQVSQRFWAAEMTREKVFENVHQEIPYHIHVFTDAWEEKKRSLTLRQTIFVQKDRYKKWILGHDGQRIRTIGLQARMEIAREVEKEVHLFLKVVTDPFWDKQIHQWG
jgi:GTP-binding protein Era